MDDFRFVIVGAGGISATYLRAIGNLAGISVSAMVSRRGSRPAALDVAVPIYPSLEAVAGPFDAVILCTPNGAHRDGAIEAARLGKHVLTEKVLATTIEAMDAMTAACAAARVQLAVTFQRRMSPDNQALKRLLESGAAGSPFAVDVRVKFYRGPDYYRGYRGGYEIDGGGPFIQQAAHQVDLLCWFFGMPRAVVSMLGTFVHEIEAEDHGVALLRYADGMIATITASTACKPGFPAVIEIHTERGSMVLQNDEIVLWEIDGTPNPAAARTAGFQVHSGAATAAVSDTAGHEAIILDFVAAIRQKRAPVAPAASARLATELALAIYQANVR
jgi:predicted dehydrogenase